MAQDAELLLLWRSLRLDPADHLSVLGHMRRDPQPPHLADEALGVVAPVGTDRLMACASGYPSAH